MSDYYYMVFAVLVGVIIGILLCCLIEWVTDNYRPKKKAKTVQPQIEVYGRNYKKINNASKFDRVG